MHSQFPQDLRNYYQLLVCVVQSTVAVALLPLARFLVLHDPIAGCPRGRNLTSPSSQPRKAAPSTLWKLVPVAIVAYNRRSYCDAILYRYELSCQALYVARGRKPLIVFEKEPSSVFPIRSILRLPSRSC